MVYGLVSKGYRFGGINITQFTPNLADPTFVTPGTYGSDSLINYEVGLKLSPSDNLRLDATVFLLDWTRLQLNVARPGDGFGYTANIGKASSKGLEFAATWTPTRTLKLESSFAYIDAKTGADYLSPSGLVPSGTELPGTAKFQMTNQASFRFDGPFGTRGRFGVTHAYVGKSYNDLYKTALQGGYSVIDSRVAFSNDNWTLSLFATNLTNKRGVAGVQAVPGFYTDYYVNRPRTIGASLAFDL
jgi:iron complex outermembrane recepter protein